MPGRGCGLLMTEYPLLARRSRRRKLLLFAIVLMCSLFATFAPLLAAWTAADTTTAEEQQLAVITFVAFGISMLILGIYSFCALTIVFGWVDGFVDLSAQAATSGHHHIEAMAARALKAYRLLDSSLGPIGFFIVTYGTLITILELYQAIGGLATDAGQFAQLVGFCVAIAFASLSLMVADASLESHEALRSLLEPLEMARTKLPTEEAVSTYTRFSICKKLSYVNTLTRAICSIGTTNKR